MKTMVWTMARMMSAFPMFIILFFVKWNTQNGKKLKNFFYNSRWNGRRLYKDQIYDCLWDYRWATTIELSSFLKKVEKFHRNWHFQNWATPRTWSDVMLSWLRCSISRVQMSATDSKLVYSVKSLCMCICTMDWYSKKSSI